MLVYGARGWISTPVAERILVWCAVKVEEASHNST